LASTYSVDRHGERIAPGAFARTLAAFNAGKQRIAVLHAHDPAQPIGTIKAATETADGLAVEGEIVLGSPTADRDHQLLLADAAGLSVGFAVADDDVDEDEKGIKVYRSVDLMEVSIVGVPSNREAIAHTVRGLASSSPAEFERLLRDGALPPLKRRLAKKVARAFLKAIAKSDPESDPEHDPAELEAVAAALERLKHSFKP
jgi:HK97 family phage prohead protease